MKTTSRHTTATHHGDVWRLTFWLALIFSLYHNPAVHAQTTNAGSVDMETGLQRVSEKIQRADLDAHSQVWQKVETFRDAEGNSVVQTNVAFVQLETGMYYREAGQWKESQALIEPITGGAVAAHGPHKVIFADNLNTAGAIDLESPDAKRFRSHVLGLAYVDTASGKSVFIAELKDCHGAIVNSNQVIYSDAFKGVKADVRYTYTKAGLEQDIILRAQPRPAADYGFNPDTTRLQVFTEFLSPPQPVIQKETFLDARGDEIQDALLDFGDLKIDAGRAFSLGEETRAGTPVSKKWLKADGRDFLVEEVALSDVATELEALPRSASISRPNKTARTAKLYQQLPRVRKSPNQGAKMLVAKLDAPKPGLVLDYMMLNGNLQNYTFKGDTTYYVSGNVILTRTTTIEGGAVVKYAPGMYVQLSSVVVCKTGPYRPAIFTARDDDTVGDILTGISTGNPGTSYYASTALAAPSYSSPALSYLKICYAAQGLYFNYVGGPDLTVRNLQFVNCQVGIATYYCSMGLKVRNALFKNVGTVFSMYSGYSSGTPDAQHITVDGSTWLWATSHPYGQGIFQNCVFANLSGLINQSGTATVGGVINGFYNAPSFGSSPTVFNPPDPSPFETVGAGSCYLNPSSISGSGFLNVGTTAIDPTLATELKTKTTSVPPTVSDNATIPANFTWSPGATRDTDTPDLGYHYEPLDVCVSGANLAGTLTAYAGTAVGFYGSYGFKNGTLDIQGGPLTRSKVAHYSAVQEQPVPAAPWGANAAACYLFKNGEMPEVVARFADITTAGGPAFSGGWVKNLNLAHSTLLAARLNHDTGGPNSHVFTNNIIQRCAFNYGLCGGPGYGIKFCNNLILHTSFSAGYFCYPGFAGSITTHNNLLAGSSFTWSGFGQPQNSHNGYYQTTVTSQGTSPVTVNTLDFQTGPLGPYYYPTTVNGQNLATLVNAGSTTADALSLCPFTTSATLETREGTTQVDIGYHYVGLDSSGQPQDINFNGPDYDEIPVANPQQPPAHCRGDPQVITLTGSGITCGPLTFTIVTGPSPGSLNTTTPANTSDTSANVIYTPPTLYCGPDSFTFKVKNNGRDSAPATVTLTVGDPNPIANCQDVMTEINTPITFTLTGTDTCNDIITFTKDSDPANGTITQFNPTTGVVTYQPPTGFEGSDPFTFHVNNCGFSSGSQTVTINVVSGPTLTTECHPTSIILSWTLPPFLQTLAASGYIQDFQIFRCSVPSPGSCTPSTTPFAEINDPLITRNPLRWHFVDSTVNSGQTFCYAIRFRHKNTCDNVTVYESPRSATSCAQVCAVPQVLVSGNNASLELGPISSFDFGSGALLNSFVPDGAANGRGIEIHNGEIFYTDLTGGFGPTDGIHVAPYGNQGSGGADIRVLNNPRPTTGIAALSFHNTMLYALTGYPDQQLQVFKLNPTTGAVMGSPISIGSPAEEDADGFTVLPNGNFLINDSDAAVVYREYSGSTGALVSGGLVIDLSSFGFSEGTGVATAPDGQSLYFIANIGAPQTLVQTSLSGQVIETQAISGIVIEDIDVVVE